MNIKEKLLYYSFKQLSGISESKEQAYWSNGILNLSHLASGFGEQQTLFSVGTKSIIEQEIDSIEEGVIDDIVKRFNDISARRDFYRIAYSYPNEIMFLDIETTGLSHWYHYVTLIGWIIDGSYHYWLPGMDETEFRATFEKAKMLVTFNGTRFDCPFLKTLFADIEFQDKPNLDLVYLCRSFGYVKGQKTIEKRMKFKRPSSVKDCDGKEAVALWYRLIFGDNSALKTLITYNFYDIAGMMYILDFIFFNYIYGKSFPKVGNPNAFYKDKLKCIIEVNNNVIHDARNYVNKNISNFDINQISSSYDYKVIGIDLAGVVNKTSKTGICYLYGKSAITKIVKHDSEIIDFVREFDPDIISIDAPLSLPAGRNSVYNDDPSAKEFGIMRYCERELKKRNVNIYPALIDSMQELTKRGIKLSADLRKLGYPVIECFPGAAQDILQLPRKRTDVGLLKVGLSRLGISGDYIEKKVYHDELDAITAALVGQFFIAGYYEEIGIEEENYLVVPNVKKNLSGYKTIIGFCGAISSGKTTAARYVSEKGFAYTRYSLVIAEMLKNTEPVARAALQEAGWQLFHDNDQYDLNSTLEKLIKHEAQVVVDGMRHFEDYTYWKERCFKNFFTVFIDTDYEISAMRYCKNGHTQMEYSTAVQHPVEAEVLGMQSLADFVISNNGNLEEFYGRIDSVIKEIKQRQNSMR